MICSIRSSSSTVGAKRGLKPHDVVTSYCMSNSINHCKDYVSMNLYMFVYCVCTTATYSYGMWVRFR